MLPVITKLQLPIRIIVIESRDGMPLFQQDSKCVLSIKWQTCLVVCNFIAIVCIANDGFQCLPIQFIMFFIDIVFSTEMSRVLSVTLGMVSQWQASSFFHAVLLHYELQRLQQSFMYVLFDKEQIVPQNLCLYRQRCEVAPCARLNWQFSVSFQARVKSSSSYRITITMA